MTICIAALCDDGPRTTIILCSDMKGSSPLGTTKYAMKESNLGDDWACLGAGSEDEYNAMLSIFIDAFCEKEEKDETNIVPLVRGCLQKRKLEKADEFLIGKWGLSYSDFRKAKSEFPETQWERDMQHVASITLDADFIVAGFLEDGLPMLLETDRHAAVRIRENYCVIGEGTYLAQATLMHRDHTEHDPLARALYCVFEAKKYAERISTVGPDTRFTIFSQGVAPMTLTAKAEAYLADLFARHGPKDLVEEEHISVPSDFFEHFLARLLERDVPP